VLILEKQPHDRHTPSTSMSGGIVMATNDVERATTYLDRWAGGMIPVEVSRAWAAKGTDLVQWLAADVVADPAGLAAVLLHAAVPGRAEHLRRPAAG
jgi:hypothetical protein